MAWTRAQKLSTMMVINASYFVIELVVGVTSGSLALAADAIHMLSDVLALAVALFAIRKARSSKVSPSINTYGYQRAELLGALANAVFLLSLCLTIVMDAGVRLIRPEVVEHPKLVLIVAAVGLALNLAGLALFHDHGHSHGTHGHDDDHSDGDHHHGDEHLHGEADTATSEAARRRKRKNTMNMHAIFLHVLADALGSVAVVVTALVLLLTTDENSPATGFVLYVDPLASIAIACLMLMHALPLAKRSGDILLNGTPKGVNLQTLRDSVMSINGVESMHDLHVWCLSDTKLIASAHIHTSESVDFESVAPSIKRAFHIAGIHSTTIQPESKTIRDDTSNGEYDCQLRCAEESCEALACCEPLQPRLSSVGVADREGRQGEGGGGDAAGPLDVPPLVPRSRPAVVELTSATVDVHEGSVP
ncbi:hypothetical protein MMPV_005204 [Pyropia vietnamensis]